MSNAESPRTSRHFPVQVSYEVFPPADSRGSLRLHETVQALNPMAPAHVSVTFGAGGAAQDKSYDAILALRAMGLEVAAHLTCVAGSRTQVLEIADRYRAVGVSKIVALRGDVAPGAQFSPGPDGFASSVELVGALAERGFEVHVSAYPDPHPEARSQEADFHWLRDKLQAGASRAITQFFFEADTFLRFRDRAGAYGIAEALVPGILPVHDWDQVRKFSARCGTPIPAETALAFDTAARHGRHDLLALSHGSELCSQLIDAGVSDLHFYTLNRPGLTRDILRALGAGGEARGAVLQEVA